MYLISFCQETSRSVVVVGEVGEESQCWCRFVTPGFKEQSRVHLIHASKKTTYIITECIEINVII
jgi:hypothetical protein